MQYTLVSILVTLALGLVACGQVDESPTPDGAETTAPETLPAPQACEQAIAQVDPDDAAEAIEQGGEALDDAIAACTVEEWLQQAGEAFGITEEEGLSHIEGRCRANPELAGVNACADPEST